MPSDKTFELLCCLTTKAKLVSDLCVELKVDNNQVMAMMREIRSMGIRTKTSQTRKIENGKATYYRSVAIAPRSWGLAQSIGNQWWSYTFDGGPPVELKTKTGHPKYKRLTDEQKEAVRACIVEASKDELRTDAALINIVEKETGIKLTRVTVSWYRRQLGIESWKRRNWVRRD